MPCYTCVRVLLIWEVMQLDTSEVPAYTPRCEWASVKRAGFEGWDGECPHVPRVWGYQDGDRRVYLYDLTRLIRGDLVSLNVHGPL